MLRGEGSGDVADRAPAIEARSSVTPRTRAGTPGFGGTTGESRREWSPGALHASHGWATLGRVVARGSDGIPFSHPRRRIPCGTTNER